MRDEMCLRYKRLMKSGYEPKLEAEEEQALYAGAQFKGKCYVCGKIGHKGANCWNRPRQGHPRFAGRGGRGFAPSAFGGGNHGGHHKRFNGTCNYCQKPGHKAIDCRLKKARERQGNSQDAAEITLCAFDFNLVNEDWEIINGELAFWRKTTIWNWNLDIVLIVMVKDYLVLSVIDVLIWDASMRQNVLKKIQMRKTKTKTMTKIKMKTRIKTKRLVM
jgi:Zinc knuckle